MNREKILPSTWIMLIILFLSLISIGYQIVLKNVVVDILNIRAPWVEATITSTDINSLQSIGVNWEAEYPFPQKKLYEQIEISGPKDSEAESKIDFIFSQFESYATEWYMGVEQSEIISKVFSKALGMNLIQDSYGDLVFQLQDGRYMAERPYVSSAEEAENVASLNNYLKSNGIDFLYVMLPSPVDPDEEASIAQRGYLEYSNYMADELLSILSQEEVDYLDLRQAMKQQGISWTDSFFKTDHHWLPDCGIWAAGQIAEQISSISGGKVNEEVFEKDNYEIKKYEGVYFGGYAKSLSSVYCEPDDIEVWYPQFDTYFEKNIPDLDQHLQGRFEDVMYNMTEWPTYNIWNHGITGIKTYHNTDEEASPEKILFITESFSDVVMPFLSCNYSNIDEIDLRCFTGSLQNYIEKSEPDMVVVLYSAYDFNSGTHMDLFNFS